MKIIGSDYDGTLNHGGIDDVKRQAIHEWREKGNIFAVVSGRCATDIIEIAKRHDFECDYFVGYNGAMIAKPDGTIVFSAECDGDIVPALVRHLLDEGCPDVFVGTDDAFEVCADKLERDEKGRFILDGIPNVQCFNQVSTACVDYETASRVTASVKEKFGHLLNPLQNGTCIDIVRKDINKAQGLYRLMEILGAKYEDIIAVGDNVNDMDMIAEFRSYAMENAVALIKDLADDITHSVTAIIEKEL